MTDIEQRQHIIALFNAGGLNPMMDLSRLDYSDVIARFVRVYELINEERNQHVDDR